jgi:hypothetical protein
MPRYLLTVPVEAADRAAAEQMGARVREVLGEVDVHVATARDDARETVYASDPTVLSFNEVVDKDLDW